MSEPGQLEYERQFLIDLVLPEVPHGLRLCLPKAVQFDLVHHSNNL